MDTPTLPPPPPTAPPAPVTGRAAATRLETAARGGVEGRRQLATVVVLLWGATQVVAQLAHEEHTTSTEYDAAGLTTLDVAIDSGSLTVVGTDADVVKVTAHISDGLRATVGAPDGER